MSSPVSLLSVFKKGRRQMKNPIFHAGTYVRAYVSSPKVRQNKMGSSSKAVLISLLTYLFRFD